MIFSHFQVEFKSGSYSWDQVLLFAFTHTNAIYINALHRERPRSFYKWAGERGNLILMIGDIYDAFVLAVRF
jgi:protein-L-isoaspartate O-methyltransferase